MMISVPFSAIIRRAVVAALLTAAASITLIGTKAWAWDNVLHSRLVAETPSNSVPRVLNGRVWAIAQWGDLVVVGGEFSAVKIAGGERISRSNLFAFSRRTGAIDSRFVVTLDRSVRSIAVDPSGRGIFIGGQFSQVNGESRRGLAFLDRDGQQIRNWQGQPNGPVADLAVLEDTLYIGGRFSRINGQRKAIFGTIAVSDGQLTSESEIVFSDPRYPTYRGRLEVRRFEISPDGSRLIVLGNFQLADGLARNQIAVLDVASSPDRIANWSTSWFDHPCLGSTLYWPYYVRDVSISPDNTYFAVATVGGRETELPHPCDMVARFELIDGLKQAPTWANYSGGDSVLSVEISGQAVYVGGHFRWMDNEFGRNSFGPGAIARSTLAALDPTTGAVLDWNPGRSPRGQGVLMMESAPDGLWLGHDTGFVNGVFSPRLTHLALLADVRIGSGLIGEEYNLSSGSQLSPTRDMLLEAENFGPNGTVPVASLSILEDVNSITQAYLDSINILFDGFVPDFLWSTDELALVADWVQAGGVVIATSDDPGYNALSNHFGNPAYLRSEDSQWLAVPPHPITDGPFGSWSNISTKGWKSYFSEKPDWEVIARDQSGRATIVTRAVGNGQVIVTGDEGIFRTGFPGDQQIMAANLFAFAIDRASR